MNAATLRGRRVRRSMAQAVIRWQDDVTPADTVDLCRHHDNWRSAEEALEHVTGRDAWEPRMADDQHQVTWALCDHPDHPDDVDEQRNG